MAHKGKWVFGLGLALGATAFGATQLKQILKVGGTAALINTFGKDINKGMNKLMDHQDTKVNATKVVPIITIALGRSNSVGAAQVMGTPEAIKKVVAVASPEAEFLGKEVRLRGLIPVSSKDVIQNIRKVDGVAVSGIVEIKL